MASRIGVRERRRRQVEQLLASGMEVREWCELNRVGRGALYAWLTEFRDTEPELFGGYEVAHAGDGHRNWFEHVRNAMAERSALALRGPAPAFAVVESLGLDPVLELTDADGAPAGRQIRHPAQWEPALAPRTDAPPRLGQHTEGVLKWLQEPAPGRTDTRGYPWR